MSNAQLVINQLQDVSTRGSLSTAYKWAVDKDPRVKMSCSWLTSSCVLLISEFRYYINATISLYSIKWRIVGLPLCCKAFLENASPHQQHLADSIQKLSNNHSFLIGQQLQPFDGVKSSLLFFVQKNRVKLVCAGLKILKDSRNHLLDHPVLFFYKGHKCSGHPL